MDGGKGNGAEQAEPPQPIPLFPLRDRLEDPRLVAYVSHDRHNISSAEYESSWISNCDRYFRTFLLIRK